MAKENLELGSKSLDTGSSGLLAGKKHSMVLASQFSVMIGLILMMVVFSLMSPVFLTTGNIMNILIQSGTNAAIAAGMTFVILAGHIDLSVGPILAFSSVVATTYMANGGPIPVAAMIGLVVATLLGMFNGICIARFKLQAFIVTMSSMWFLRGLCYVYSNGRAVMGLPPAYRKLAAGKIFGIPNVVFIVVIVYALGHFVLAKTKLGRHIYAIGDNKDAAYLSGVNVQKVEILVFMISGFCAGLSGLIYSSRLFSGQPVAGSGYELSAIAAVVIGGTSLSGGVGSIGGTLIGVLFISTLMNGLTILNVSAFWQQVFMGFVILGAVFLDHYRKTLIQA